MLNVLLLPNREVIIQQIKHILNLLWALQYISEVLGPKFTRKLIEKPMHTRAIFSKSRKKRAQKKLINIYEAVFCLTLNGVFYL